MDNLEEMDKFLERYNLPTLKQEELENKNRTTTSTKNWYCDFKKSNRSPGSDGFACKFCQKFREELTAILLKLLQKTAEEGTLPNSFYEATITLMRG